MSTKLRIERKAKNSVEWEIEARPRNMTAALELLSKYREREKAMPHRGEYRLIRETIEVLG